MPVTVTFQPHEFFTIAPEILLTFWGLLVLLVDLGAYRRLNPDERRRRIGRLARVGAVLTLVCSLAPLIVRFDLYGLGASLNFSRIDYSSEPDPFLFFGALSDDLMTQIFNVVFAALLCLVVWMSTVWSFTENWGEYFALMLWSTVGMMLLTASEELLTLFLTLETMTICLYLSTAFEKDRKRSAEGGLKYFVYGSVSSALFLFGLSMIYGLTGSTQFFAIREALQPFQGPFHGLAGNVAGATAVLLMLVGFGFKIAAVPFHQWAPDAYEGAPAPVTAWIATGSKIASFVALMKVLFHALGPYASRPESVLSPGWIGIVVVLSAASMTYGNFAALAQTNLKRMLAYSSIAHAGYMLVGVAAAGVSTHHAEAAGAVLFYLIIYGFTNVGAFALAAWLARDKGSDEIADLNGLGIQYPGIATCVLLLMLSLIGMPPLAGFFGKLYMFMEALDEWNQGRLTLLWLVALGLLNSVVSAFYYVRVLKAMFLRGPSNPKLASPPSSVTASIVLATIIALGFGIYPAPLVNMMRAAAVPMLTESGIQGYESADRRPMDGARPSSTGGGPGRTQRDPLRYPDPITTPPLPPSAGDPSGRETVPETSAETSRSKK
ncbi:MAG: NADH-quinone oxidoreductase subunit N [Isosphaeraceae bacterium]